MYNEYFGLTDRPFSIAPDPRYLYMSEQHREALAHLMYGVQQEGGFILLTGEVGTGKTTVCRCFLKQLDDSIDVAYIVNPKQTSLELLESMCDDLSIPRVQDDCSIKSLTDVITHRLLTNHAKGKSTVLLIDEAQNLSVEVLEQLRLLTNLETDQKKLLQIILLGQPELLDILAKPELRQLSQRVTARFHMGQLSRKDIIPYVQHRLAVAGCRMALFPQSTARIIEKASGGVPRLINLICDRALLGVYSSNGTTVTTKTLKQAAKEVLGEQRSADPGFGANKRFWLVGSIVLAVQFVVVLGWLLSASPKGSPEHENPEQERTALTETSDSTLQVQNSDVREDTLANPPLSSLFNSNAMSQLSRSWGLDMQASSPEHLCTQLEQTRLACESQNVSWSKFLTLNRPVVAKALYQGKVRSLVVDKLAEENGTVRLRVLDKNNTHQWLDQSLFEQIWTGQIEYLWLQPEPEMPLLKPGDVHKYIHSVRQLFTGIEGEPIYDEALSLMVRDFQSDMGVLSDGVIGPETIMLINSVSGKAPVLRPSPKSSLVRESDSAFQEGDQSKPWMQAEMEHRGAQG